jgi:hypothetical protein
MSNTTTPGDAHVNFYYVFTIIMLCLFILVAFFGNLIVLVIFLSTKELQTQVNYFLASLALADLLTAIFPMPLWLAVKINVNGYWPFSEGLLKVWRCADLIFCSASVWNLCAISIDRCLAISRPFLHRTWLTPFRVKCAVGMVWGYSCMLAILITDTVTWKKRGLLISCLSYYIPAVIIVAAYLIIYISRIKSRFELDRQENIDVSSNNRSKQDLRMAKYMILLIASFLICWAGHFIMGTIMAFTTLPRVNPFLKDCIKGMSYLNSSLNPFLYGYVSPKFRVAFKGILCKCCRKDSRHAWTQMSPARSTFSRRTSSTKVATGQRHSTASQDDAV